MSRIRIPNFALLVNGEEIPITGFNVSLGSNESLSTITAESSVAMLRTTGIDVYSASQTEKGCPLDLYAGYDGDFQHVFGGVLDAARWQWKNDKILWEGRDHGAVLADTREVMVKINYKNQTIGQIVQQIADQFDLGTDIEDPGTMAGCQMWDDAAFMPHEQEYWSVLQSLAQQVGYVVFVKPDKTLVFKPLEEAGGQDVTVTWCALPGTDAENPLLDLETYYQPRRNGNVKVKVLSYHQPKRKPIKAESMARIAPLKSSKSHGKVLVGRSAKGKAYAAGGGSKPAARPALVIRQDGLTQEQADQMAQAEAKNLAKKQVIITGTVEGLPEMVLHSRLKLRQGQEDLMGFDSLDYILTSVNHTFSMPGDSGGEGWTTEFTAMTEAQVS